MIGITMGDGNGVGPEIILRSYKEGLLSGDYVVIGDMSVMELCNRILGFEVKLNAVRDINGLSSSALNVLDMGLLAEDDITPGVISKKVAAASREYVVKGCGMTIEGSLSAITTLPVNKEAIRLTDPGFTGHTELIAEMCGDSGYAMMLASKKLNISHVSTHVSMEEAIRLVKKARVLRLIELTNGAIGRFKKEPVIAVAGLNPHAGEGGAFGAQDAEEIEPAVCEARAMGINAVGPLPPDTVFLRAFKGEFDAVVSMYHDQGHIPGKLLDFDGGVNVTLGIKIIRTSVDHGTAYDIAYKGKAATGSFTEAFNYARKMIGDC